MSAHHRGLTLRATLIALALGVSLYVATICGIIAYQIAPRAAAIQKQSARLHAEFEASSERAAALKSAIDETRNLMSRIAPDEAESLKAKIQAHVDSAGAVQSIGVLSGIPGEMRILLGRAANAESQLGALLIEALAEMELGRHAEAETRLAHCDFLQTIIASHLSEAQRLGFMDLIRREKSLGEAADSAIKMVIWWAAIGAALIPAFALFVQHRFYRPLAELDRGLARVAGGDIEATVEIRREDELGRLSQHFNRMTDVLRQRAEEERLRAHNLTERFGRILDQSVNEIYIFDATTYHFLQVNRGARENLGYTEEEFSTLTPMDLMPEFDRASFDELAARLRAGQREMAMITTVHRRRDGTTYPVEINIQISRLETPAVMVSIVRDITERKRMEEALRESEERFRLAIDAAQMGTWDWNLLTDKVRRTGRAYHLLGASEEMLGDSPEAFFDRVHPLDRQRIREALQRAIGEGAPYSEEFRVLMPDGQVCWRAAQATIFRDDIGQPSRMVGIILDITERKRAEEALRLSEEKFAKAFRSGPNSMIISSLVDGRYIEVNDTFLNLTGYAREEIIGRTTAEMNIWEKGEDRARLIKEIEEQGRVSNFETGYRKKSGEVGFVLLSAEVIELEGEPCLLAVSADITERRQTEEALRASERRFSKAFNASPNPMTIATLKEARFIDVNEAFLSVFGSRREDVIGRTVGELRIWVSPQVSARVFRTLVQQGMVRDMEAEFRMSDGEVRTLTYSAEVIDLDGEKCVLSQSNDMTERKRTEQALRESEQMFRTLAETVAVGIYIYRDNRLVYANPAAEAIGGYTREELLDLDPWEAVHPDYREAVKERNLARREGAAAASRYEMKILTKAGEERWVDVTTAAINYQGRDSLLVTSFDITERKRAEEALRESEQMFRTLTETITMAIYIYRGNRYLYVNSAAEKITGYSRDELMAMEFLALVYEEDKDRLIDYVERRRRGEQAPNRYEMRFVHKTGEVRWIDVTVAQIEYLGEPAYLVTAIEITERKQAEAALRESQRLLSSITHNITEAIYRSTPEKGLIYINESFVRMFGYESVEEILRTPSSALYVDARRRDELKDLITREGSFINQEILFRRRDGSHFWGLNSSIAIYDDEGKILYYDGAIWDITERKRAEAALRESEERFYRAFNASPMFMGINRLSDGAYIDVNEAALRESGFTREELLGKTPEEVGIWIDPEDRQRVASIMEEKGRIREFEIRHRRKTGEERVSLLSAEIIETGGERCLLTTAFDITSRKRAEKELRESEERFSKAFQASPLSMTIAALSDGCIIAANQSFLQANGFAHEEVIGRTAQELGLWVDPSERQSFMRRIAEQGEVREAEVRTRTGSGEERVVLLSGVIIELGGEPCVLFTGSDITERKRAEEEIQRLNEELEHRVVERTAQLEAVNRELEAFSYSVSHDLRAPLRSINGFSLALMEDYAAQLDETAMDYLSRVRAASQRMGRLIDDLLNLSRITRSDMHRERVDLSAIAHAVATEIQSTDSGREAEFRIAPDLVAQADPRLVHIALENLLGNSWKFTEKKERAEIEFGCARQEGECVFFVRDNGAGFDMSYADKLFGAFQRLHPMAEFKGTGIGLATVQRIIHRHGGRIWAEGEVGRGATFYFTLP
ncbi:MAG: PAS domain S-box protein [Acidobacteriota bacterium]